MDMLFPSYVCPIYLGRFRIVRDCREMSKKFFGFSNELIDKVIEIS